ncbi:MAG: hypothetical protein JXA23_07940, partial [Bacteroidales bacterium]|nr:hypothetical protein [Bacteroidales bacterium]
MMVIRKQLLFVLLAAVITFFSSCKKDKIDTAPSSTLSFSTDTLFFDTVFTTIGSVTQRLVVYNTNDGILQID